MSLSLRHFFRNWFTTRAFLFVAVLESVLRACARVRNAELEASRTRRSPRACDSTRG